MHYCKACLVYIRSFSYRAKSQVRLTRIETPRSVHYNEIRKNRNVCYEKKAFLNLKSLKLVIFEFDVSCILIQPKLDSSILV